MDRSENEEAGRRVDRLTELDALKGNTPDEIEALFDALDTNHDGVISREEPLALVDKPPPPPTDPSPAEPKPAEAPKKPNTKKSAKKITAKKPAKTAAPTKAAAPASSAKATAGSSTAASEAVAPGKPAASGEAQPKAAKKTSSAKILKSGPTPLAQAPEAPAPPTAPPTAPPVLHEAPQMRESVGPAPTLVQASAPQAAISKAAAVPVIQEAAPEILVQATNESVPKMSTEAEQVAEQKPAAKKLVTAKASKSRKSSGSAAKATAPAAAKATAPAPAVAKATASATAKATAPAAAKTTAPATAEPIASAAASASATTAATSVPKASVPKPAAAAITPATATRAPAKEPAEKKKSKQTPTTPQAPASDSPATTAAVEPRTSPPKAPAWKKNIADKKAASPKTAGGGSASETPSPVKKAPAWKKPAPKAEPEKDGGQASPAPAVKKSPSWKKPDPPSPAAPQESPTVKKSPAWKKPSPKSPVSEGSPQPASPAQGGAAKVPSWKKNLPTKSSTASPSLGSPGQSLKKQGPANPAAEKSSPSWKKNLPKKTAADTGATATTEEGEKSVPAWKKKMAKKSAQEKVEVASPQATPMESNEAEQEKGGRRMSLGQEFGLADAEATKSSSSDDPSQLTGAAVPKARGAGKVLGTPRGTTEKTEEKAQAEEKKEPEVKEQVEEKNPLEMTYVIPGNGVATRSGRQLFAPSMRIDFGPSLQELLAKTEFSIKARAEDPPEQREYNASRGREIIMGQLERSKWDQGPTVDSIWDSRGTTRLTSTGFKSYLSSKGTSAGASSESVDGVAILMQNRHSSSVETVRAMFTALNHPHGIKPADVQKKRALAATKESVDSVAKALDASYATSVEQVKRMEDLLSGGPADKVYRSLNANARATGFTSRRLDQWKHDQELEDLKREQLRRRAAWRPQPLARDLSRSRNAFW